MYGVTILFFLVGAVASLTVNSIKGINYTAHSMAALGSVGAALCAVFVLYGTPLSLVLPANPIWLFGGMRIAVDVLSAYFLLMLGLVGVGASVYAIGNSARQTKRQLRYQALFFNLFLLSLVLVFTASHIILFLVSWELMALFSFFLVNSDYEQQATRRASFLYFIMTHVGTVFVIAAFFLLASASQSLEFGSLSAKPLSENLQSVVFLCALLGFGTKAGLVPLHIWMPAAYRAAPHQATAVMSGIMVKTAVYSLCRFIWVFLPTGPGWWGGLMVTVGLVSAVIGILYGLVEKDIKKSLAYSSVEHIGIILVGLGAGVLFASMQNGLLAALAWSAAALHMLYHAVTKAMMFLGAGSVIRATGTYDMDKMGGLGKRLPFLSGLLLLGCAGMAALPPLPLFFSEWLTFQVLFQAGLSVNKPAAGLAIALLGMTGALAAATFVRMFGSICLAKPRQYQAEKPVARSMMFGTVWLAACAVGLMGSVAITNTWINRIFVELGCTVPIVLTAYTGPAALPAGGSLVPVMLVGTLAVLAAAIYSGLRLWPTQQRTLASETWTCGIVPTARMSYTATGFSKPVRLAFKEVLQPYRQRQVVQHAAHVSAGQQISYHTGMGDIFRSRLYNPLHEKLLGAAVIMRRMQAGSVQLYVAYITLAALATLVWVTWR